MNPTMAKNPLSFHFPNTGGVLGLSKGSAPEG
jgi:hypothetical protein